MVAELAGLTRGATRAQRRGRVACRRRHASPDLSGVRLGSAVAGRDSLHSDVGPDEDGWVVLARFTDGRAALMERRVDEARVLLFASDLGHAWNDFPVHPAFVPFMHETIRYATRARRSPRELFVADAPEDAPRRPGVVAWSRDDASQSTSIRGSRIPRRSTRRRSRQAPASCVPRRAPDKSADARAREESQRYWRYGLMLMLVALAAEGLVAGGYRFA